MNSIVLFATLPWEVKFHAPQRVREATDYDARRRASNNIADDDEMNINLNYYTSLSKTLLASAIKRDTW